MWRVKYQPFEGDPWIELVIVASTDDGAWTQFAAWRRFHSVGYHAVMVYRDA